MEQLLAARVLRCAIAFAVGVLAAAALAAALAPADATAIFRAFSPSSPWNQTAHATEDGNPYAGQFTTRPDLPLRFSGTPDNITYGAPVYFAQPGDPSAPVVVTQPDWLPDGDTRWDRRPVPVPLGVRPAPGSDGHLTVVSADRGTAWDFLGCTQAGPLGYVAKVIVQWDLEGPGYSRSSRDTSARGSGTPLISTALRGEEALRGIRHALGFTVPDVSAEYVLPATHSDGKLGPSAVKYGMRFVLRPDYPLPPRASIGVVNVVYALKVYGAYLVDQGADFTMDADFTRPELWQAAGLNYKSLNIHPSDFRPAEIGAPASIPTIVSSVTEARRPSSVRLRANRRPLRVGSNLHLSGRVRGELVGYERANVEARVRGRWRFLLSGPVTASGRFAVRTKLHEHERSEAGRPVALRLRHLHLRPGTRLRLRAAVRRFGRSNIVAVRLGG